jgi:hypothetical protein
MAPDFQPLVLIMPGEPQGLKAQERSSLARVNSCSGTKRTEALLAGKSPRESRIPNANTVDLKSRL